MKKFPRFLALSSCLAVAVFAAAPHATAATLVQIDFQDPLDGSNMTTADAVTAGTSAEFLAQGTTPTLSTGTAVGSGVIASLATGYISMNRTNSNYLQSSPTSGSGNGNAEYRDYVPGNTTGTGTGSLAATTIYMVIQPGSITGTYGLFSSAANSSGGQTAFSMTSTGLAMNVGHSNGGNATSASLTGLSWNASSWYFVAASYGTGVATSVYYRVLKDGAGTIDPNGAGSINTGGITPIGTISGAALATLIDIGAGTNSSATAQNFYNGKIAYFEMGSGSTDQTGYNSIFNSLLVPVPEPSTIALLALGCGSILFFRRRRAFAPGQSVR